MDIKKVNVNLFQVEELACKITGLDYDEIDANTDLIEEKMNEDLDISLTDFAEIVARLLPLIDVGTSPLTNESYKGFSDIDNKMWLIKIKI